MLSHPPTERPRALDREPQADSTGRSMDEHREVALLKIERCPRFIGLRPGHGPPMRRKAASNARFCRSTSIRRAMRACAASSVPASRQISGSAQHFATLRIMQWPT